MLASLTDTVPDTRLITDLLLFHCWRRRRGQQWKDQSLNVAISTRECYRVGIYWLAGKSSHVRKKNYDIKAAFSGPGDLKM